MSKPADILSQLKTQLENSSYLSYVKNVFLGARENIILFPCLILEPLRLIEADDVYSRQELKFRIGVMGYIHTTIADKQISGDANTKGILDLENDVKKAISSDRTIGGNAIFTSIIETVYEFVEYPIRSFALEIEILFRQDSTGRT